MLGDQSLDADKRSVAKFFDALTDDYAAAIQRCFPRYQEMLWALLDYLPRDRTFNSILELGCGTGTLSLLLHQAFPTALLRLVDVSGESLDVCRSRIELNGSTFFDQMDFRDLAFEESSFDLIVSSISIHHLDSSEKQSLFRRVHGWLKKGGVFSFADQCAGASADLSVRHVENWKELTFSAGSSNEEWEMWMQHQTEHDHHDTLANQLVWLNDAGFTGVDCTWRYLLWSVFQARK